MGKLYVNKTSLLRDCDDHGSGAYGASRGKRTHKGIDLVAFGGTEILAASEGLVTRSHGIVYTDPLQSKWQYVEITDNDGIECRYFYVAGELLLGDHVEKDQSIGYAQGIEQLYKGITPHIHFETRRDKANYIDPNEYLAAL